MAARKAVATEQPAGPSTAHRAPAPRQAARPCHEVRTPLSGAGVQAALEFALQLSKENLHSDLVRQDVLILASRDDHLVPFWPSKEQLRRLASARSVANRVSSTEDHAQNHRAIGDIGLALQVMKEWIDAKEAIC